ncbi:MAG: response regulator [Chloroflexota bacterium]|nr:response regulator [Chloroflexota bacterium]
MTGKVLIADDEAAVVKLLLTTLGDDDRYRLLVARDGEEALQIARQEKPDLVFLDILMPKVDGFRVCRALKANPATAHMKVVMLTALAQDSDREEAIRAGADGYLAKPFSPTGLLEKVEDVFNSTG